MGSLPTTERLTGSGEDGGSFWATVYVASSMFPLVSSRFSLDSAVMALTEHWGLSGKLLSRRADRATEQL